MTMLRAEDGSGQFDARDYQVKGRPLAFDRLAEEWLDIKRPNMKPGGWQSIKAIMAHAQRQWGQANIKSIRYAQIEDFLHGLDLAKKTKHNILTTLKQFWGWAAKRYDIPMIEEWPELGKIEMALRKTIDLNSQNAIINDIKEHEPYRTWLCIKWLATYIKVRPSEMLSITEKNIDREHGGVLVLDTKEREPKMFPLTDEDLAIVRGLPLAFNPDTPFFRHDGRRGHTRAGGRFSRQMLWATWKRACARLGIEGVDLYGGTKHSTASGMRSFFTYEEVRKMTGHTTNKAFDRYIQFEGSALKGMYEARQMITNSDNGLITEKRHTQNS